MTRRHRSVPGAIKGAAIDADNVIRLAKLAGWLHPDTTPDVYVDGAGQMGLQVYVDGRFAPMTYQGLVMDTRALAAALNCWPVLELRRCG